MQGCAIAAIVDNRISNSKFVESDCSIRWKLFAEALLSQSSPVSRTEQVPGDISPVNRVVQDFSRPTASEYF